MRQNKNKPNPKFDSVAPGERKKGKTVKAKDYFLNRKGVSENTIKEIKKEKSSRAKNRRYERYQQENRRGQISCRAGAF